MGWVSNINFSLADLHGFVSRRAVIIVVMAVMIYQGVGVFYKTLTIQLVRTRPASAPEAKAQAAVIAGREPADTYRIVPERNIFGTTNKSAESRQASAAGPQQDISLLFEVKGTVAGDEKYGFAIIEERGTKKQRLVKAGDVVAGAKVLRIKRNAVDVLVEEKERTLKMAEMKESQILPPAPAAVAQPTTLTNQQGALVLNRNELQETMADMGTMLSQAQVRPYFNAGVPDGFVITSIQAGSLYQKMGIVNGDIIQEVNNRKIQTADDLSGLLTTLKSTNDISLVVKRGGSPRTLSYQFR